MRNKVLTRLGTILVAGLFVVGMTTIAAAQGRGRGGGVGPPARGGPPPGTGVDRGLGRSSDASAGRADTRCGNASARSNGRPGAGLKRARAARGDLRD